MKGNQQRDKSISNPVPWKEAVSNISPESYKSGVQKLKFFLNLMQQIPN